MKIILMSSAVRTASSSRSPHRSATLLHEIATQLRIDSVRATTAAASGHPTSCASCAEIMSVLCFEVMRYDVREPRAANNDAFVLSTKAFGNAARIERVYPIGLDMQMKCGHWISVG